MLLLPARASNVVRAFSFGGGVQSNAVMVLQAQGKVHYDLFIFANVGADSENPDTLAYIENYSKPFCHKHGIQFVEVRKTWADGHSETLWEYMQRTQRSIPIPLRMGGNGAPGRRSCTEGFKIEVIGKYLKGLGYTHFIKGIGFSTDELHRLRDPYWYAECGIQVRREHPLVDLRMDRQACKQVIASAGLPIPPKSACFFCPFHQRNEWIEMKRNRPDLFQRAVELEKMLNARRNLLGKDRLFMHRSVTPLDQAVGNQLLLFDFDALDTCDAGVCMI